MEDPASSLDASHPLRADEARLELVMTAMWNHIHKVLNWPRSQRRAREARSGTERAIRGTGVSVDDIMNEALTDLLSTTEPGAVRSWEALAITIADRRAKDALRSSQKGLRGTASRARLRLVSGDEPIETSSGDESATTVFDAHPESAFDGEEAYLAVHRAQAVVELARELLTERDQCIFLELHFFGVPRKELGAKLDLTPQRVGQIYAEALAVLEAHPKYPYPDDDKEPGAAK